MLINLIFNLAGGIALFFFGVFSISKGLQKIAGEKSVSILEKITNHPIKGIFVGTGITILFQSSSLTMVTLIGLINAGLMNLKSAVGVMLGADIGTTVTAQIVVFQIGKYILPLIALGMAMMYLGRNRYLKYLGEAIFGFGILFLGMEFMKIGVKPLQNLPIVTDLFVNLGKFPILGVLVAAVFTSIIQSSSVTTVLVIAMASQGLLSINATIPLVLGANIGTTITAVIASIGSSLSSKRLALAQVLYNVIGVGICLILLTPFTFLVLKTSGYLPRQVANAHTIFNFLSALIALPLVGGLILLVKKIIPGEEIKVDRGIKFLEKKILNMPLVALSQVYKELIRMAEITSNMFENTRSIFETTNPKIIKEVFEQEEAIDEMYKSISDYLVKLSTKPLTKTEAKRLAGYTHGLSEIERIADHIYNIAELAEKKINQKLSFSKEAEKELNELILKIEEVYKNTLIILQKGSKEDIKIIIKGEKEIDKLESDFQENHIKRLESGICKPEAGILFVDILKDLERIGDHLDSLAHIIDAEF